MEVEIEVMLPRAKDPNTASNTEAEGEAWNGSALTASEGTAPALTVTSDLQPPDPCDNTILLFLSHSLVVWLKLIQVGPGDSV